MQAMKTFPNVVLALCAVGFLGFGLWLLVDPVGALAKIGIVSTSKVGEVELRAFYGGMEIGLGLFVAWCCFRPEWQQAGLWMVLLASGGAGLARLLGIFLSGAALGSYLGWALLQANQPGKAETVYREDLRRYPGNGWGLLGLSQSLAAQGKTKEAATSKDDIL